MIAIDNVLISDQVIDEHFVCDLEKCKGGCCVEGDAGAPLEKAELKELQKAIKEVLPYLTKEGRQKIEKDGLYTYDYEFGWVTPVIQNGMCAYGMVGKNGVVKCGIEQAFNDGKLSWKKPVSCHLFPIKIAKTNNTDLVNYEPREGLCDPACQLGKKLKIPAYQFLKEPLIRKYGEKFYEALQATAAHLQKEGK